MSGLTKRAVTEELRAVFAQIADYLIPAYQQLPSASEVDIAHDLLDRVLAVRPDLIEPLVRGLTQSLGKDAKQAAEFLSRNDAEAFDALSTSASGGYYLDPTVRDVIGYPGQELITNSDPYALPSYVADGSLQRVFQRGPIYVPTPGEQPKSHHRLLGAGQ